jgi:hypothetical protein
MQPFVYGWIVFRMRDTTTGAHQLDLSRFEFTSISHTVQVSERTFQNITENFHIPMRVFSEPLARFHPVLINDSQGSEFPELGVVISREAECMPGLEPAVIGITPVF